MLQELLPEHMVLVASYLDGDSYVSLSQTNDHNYQLLNDKRFLQLILRLNRYPFVVLDAKYYAYSYAGYFLTKHRVKVHKPILRMVLRTLKRGKMTKESVETLQNYMSELKAGGQKRADNDRLWEKIAILLQQTILEETVYKDLHALTEDADIRGLYIYTNLLPVTGDDSPDRLVAACAKNKHELISELLEGDCAKLKSLPADLFLSGKSDATTITQLLALSDRLMNPDEIACKFISQDNAKALKVLLEFCDSNKISLTSFSLHECCEFDAVRCFGLFIERNYGGLPKTIVHESVLRKHAYGIRRCYDIESTMGTKITSFLVEATISTVKWALGM